jgi:mannose-6-phosphate isomerase-like protein (cupin superfamily)
MKRAASSAPIERHYSFDDCTFEHVRAHGGAQEISFARALTRDRGSIRFIDLSVLGPGADIGLHTHEADNEELYIVVSGKGWMTLDGHQFEVRSGHVVLNRPGGTHALKNIGDEELRIVVIEVESEPDNGREPA